MVRESDTHTVPKGAMTKTQAKHMIIRTAQAEANRTGEPFIAFRSTRPEDFPAFHGYGAAGQAEFDKISAHCTILLRAYPHR